MNAKMKVGIAIPCHERDIRFLKKCLNSIQNLDLQAHYVTLNINRGERTLKQIRTDMFNHVFKSGCDVALQCSSDFYLFPQILRYVDTVKVTTFPFLARRPSDFFTVLLTLLGRGWTGCYSVPRDIWFSQLRDNWDGNDSSILNLVGRKNVVSIKRPCYYAMRPWQPSAVSKTLSHKSLLKRVWWMATRLKA